MFNGLCDQSITESIEHCLTLIVTAEIKADSVIVEDSELPEYAEVRESFSPSGVVVCEFPEIYTRFESLLQPCGTVVSLNPQPIKGLCEVDIRLHKPLVVDDWWHTSFVDGSLAVDDLQVINCYTPIHFKSMPLNLATRVVIEITTKLNSDMCHNPYSYQLIENAVSHFANRLPNGLLVHQRQTIQLIQDEARETARSYYAQILERDLAIREEEFIATFCNENPDFWARVEYANGYENEDEALYTYWQGKHGEDRKELHRPKQLADSKFAQAQYVTPVAIKDFRRDLELLDQRRRFLLRLLDRNEDQALAISALVSNDLLELSEKIHGDAN